jgi:membrane protease YdiL (CAAX protease family)
VIVQQVCGLLFVVMAVWYLRWRRPVTHEELRTRRWVWLVPSALLAACLFAADWDRIARAGSSLVVASLVAMLLIAASEELVFRGVALHAFRQKYSETLAASATVLLFAGAHTVSSLAFSPLQFMSTLLSGILFYLTRRVSGGLVLPVLVHAAIDFSLFSNAFGGGEKLDNRGPVILLVEVILVIVAAVFHSRISPRRRTSHAVRS